MRQCRSGYFGYKKQAHLGSQVMGICYIEEGWGERERARERETY